MLMSLLLLGGSLALLSAARAYKHGPRCRWTGSCRAAVIGDSISAGAYPSYLRQLLPRYTFDVYGGVGQGTATLAAALQQALAVGYDEVIIQGGMNDLSQGADYIIENLKQLCQLAKSSGARVVLLSLTPYVEAAQLVHDINKQLKWRSLFWGIDDYVDIWTPLHDDRWGLRGDLQGDQMGIHPNSTGARLIAQRIYDDAY